MYERLVKQNLEKALLRAPAVVLLGPRQVGKTTLAKSLISENGTYLDLQDEAQAARLANPRQYLRMQQGRLLVLDEVQHLPTLFNALRGAIDEGRQLGQKSGMFLLLGSASLSLIQQTSESLAGRVAFAELGGLHRLELPAELWEPLWLRGGFPESLLAQDDAQSAEWRRDFIKTYLLRDVAAFAPRASAELLRRLWTMLAHLQGSLLNASDLARALEVSAPTVGSYIDLLVDLLLVRRLQPWHKNSGKRLTKSPKVYIRDSGLVHRLLGIANMDALLSHPAVGASWEGHVIESLLAVAPSDMQASFYRSAGGAEIDLILSSPDGQDIAIEIKRSDAPKLAKGFFSACEDVRPSKRWLVHGGSGRFWLQDDVQALSLDHALNELSGFV